MKTKDGILSSLHITLDDRDYTYKEIFDNYMSLSIGNFIVAFDPLERYFTLTGGDNIYFFYIIPLKINIKKDNIIKSYENIYSYEQI